jgi:hypothetical protein
MMPFARADGAGRDGHALEHQMRAFGQQHAVLEGAGLPLVGIADDERRSAVRLRRVPPLGARRDNRRRRSREAAGLDRVEDLRRASLPAPSSDRPRRAPAQQNGAGMAQVVLDHGARLRCGVEIVEALSISAPGGGPPSGARPRSGHLPGRQIRQHDVVDHRRRGLVAHADARRVFQRKGAVGAGLADLDAEARLERGLNRREPRVPVDDVVAKPDRDPTLGVSDKKA